MACLHTARLRDMIATAMPSISTVMKRTVHYDANGIAIALTTRFQYLAFYAL
jgi:hypothetical protein